MSRLRGVILSGALLALTACDTDEASTADNVVDVPPAPAAAVARADVPGSGSLTPAAPSENATDPGADEAAAARRLADAQAYLDNAGDAAEERHQRAMAICQDGSSSVEFDICVQSAEESLQVELRAARVEFDARMANPN